MKPDSDTSFLWWLFIILAFIILLATVIVIDRANAQEETSSIPIEKPVEDAAKPTSSLSIAELQTIEITNQLTTYQRGFEIMKQKYYEARRNCR